MLAAQAEEVDARILSAIIAGVRRAFPFVATEDVQPLIEKHSDALFKMIHTAPFSVAVQALLLLFQLMSAQNAINDRFYRYKLHPTDVRKQSMSGSAGIVPASVDDMCWDVRLSISGTAVYSSFG